MSLKDDLLNGLKEFKVWRIDIDRDVYVKGQPAIKVTIYTTTHNPHEFTFAKANQMTTQHMLSVIRSYLEHRVEVAV
jgi:hypothetical protein